MGKEMRYLSRSRSRNSKVFQEVPNRLKFKKKNRTIYDDYY